MTENNDVLTEEQSVSSGGEDVKQSDAGGEAPAESNESTTEGVDESVSEVVEEVKSAAENKTVETPSPAPPSGDTFRADVSMDSGGFPTGGAQGSLDLLMDVNITLRVELGRTRKTIAEILKLSPGMLVELDRSSSDDVDIFVNDKLLASGEVTVVDGHFAIKVTKILDKAERIRSMM